MKIIILDKYISRYTSKWLSIDGSDSILTGKSLLNHDFNIYTVIPYRFIILFNNNMIKFKSIYYANYM